MANLERDPLSTECASLIEDVEAELRAIRASVSAHASTRPRVPDLRVMPAGPLRSGAGESRPPPLPQRFTKL